MPSPTAFPRGSLLAILVILQLPLHAQQDTTATPNRRCLINTSAALGAGMAGSLILLDRAWYADHERAPLHTFDDSGEWLQVDKAGHFFSAYTLGRWGHALLDRCDAPRKTSIWLGGSLGLIFLTGVEFLDGTSAAWGFSWSDMAANAAGSGFFIGQQLLWDEQRILVKFSAHPTRFAELRPNLLGEGLAERVLKDYNGQTIWLSANINRLTGLQVPEWLAIAGGYGATGMITAHPPEPMTGFYGHERVRQYFISPDIDISRFRTRSKVLNTVLFVLNGVKVPLPALEFRGNGRVIGHWLYF